VAQLTPESDYAAFAKRSVDPQVRNAAMKKLFTDPHYNVMDGLDTYIDDYNKSDPIPKSMLRQMVQARFLGLLDDELEEQPKPPPDGVVSRQQTVASDDLPLKPNAEPAAITADPDATAIDPAVTDLASPHEDLDLQLQRHDADRQRGPHEPVDGQAHQRKPDQP
jgi:cell division septation protein DedD